MPFLTFRRGLARSSSTCAARRMALGGYLPARRRQGARRSRCRSSSAFERLLKSTEDREISTTMAFVQILQHAAARQEHRQARRADRARRVAHLRHGGHVPPARHLQPGRASSTRRRMPTSSCSTRRTRTARSCRRASTRPGAHVRLDRRGDVVLDARRADDPVLHLLLDVRLPAHRRPRLGGRRHARARLPARRHRRAHHAQRRGPAARGRPLAHLRRRRSRTASPTTRPSPTRSR